MKKLKEVKPVICPYCTAEAKLVGGSFIYPHRPDLAHKKFWLCAGCDAYVGTHKYSKDHKPLGRLANKELRALKAEAHKLFDKAWKEDPAFSRTEAYAQMSELMGIPRKECHIGYFDIEECNQLINLLT